MFLRRHRGRAPAIDVVKCCHWRCKECPKAHQVFNRETDRCECDADNYFVPNLEGTCFRRPPKASSEYCPGFDFVSFCYRGSKAKYVEAVDYTEVQKMESGLARLWAQKDAEEAAARKEVAAIAAGAANCRTKYKKVGPVQTLPGGVVRRPIRQMTKLERFGDRISRSEARFFENLAKWMELVKNCCKKRCK